jgi:hypothetical protein
MIDDCYSNFMSPWRRVRTVITHELPQDNISSYGYRSHPYLLVGGRDIEYAPYLNYEIDSNNEPHVDFNLYINEPDRRRTGGVNGYLNITNYHRSLDYINK